MDYYGLLILLVGVVLPMAFLLFLIFLLKKTRGFLANALAHDCQSPDRTYEIIVLRSRGYSATREQAMADFKKRWLS